MISFAIFKAKEKRSDKSPDYTSTVKVENEVVLRPGIEYSLAGWIKEAKTGTKYISVVIKPKEDYKKNDSTKEWDDGFSSPPPSNEAEPF